MRILQVVEFATPAKGGLVQAALVTATGLAARGHDVELWTSKYGQIPAMPGIRVRAFRGLLFNGLIFTPGLLWPAITELRKFDLIHLHAVRSVQSVAVSTCARLAGVPYVLSPHGTLTTNGQKVMAKYIFDCLAQTGQQLHRAELVATVSDLEAETCVAVGIDRSRIRITFNPVETVEVHSKPTWAQSNPVIGYLGRLERSKAIDKLIEAFAHARSVRPDLRLEIAGPDDGDLHRLQMISSSAGLSEVVSFRGPLYGHAKHEFLSKCAVFANPRSFEIFGISVFEAIAQCCPVVVSRQSGSAKLAEQSGAGLIVDTDDPIAFGQALLAQIDLPLDNRLRAQQFVHSFLSVEAYLDRVEQMYSEMRYQVA